MRVWITLLHWVHDNITLIFFFIVACMILAAWVIYEAFRSHRSRDEVFKLRQRLYTIEREGTGGKSFNSGPVVLSSRWIGVGAAATTSDGGCLILVEGASPFQRKAMMTVRVDGLAVKRNETIGIGDRLEVNGKSGTYSIELHAAETNQARFVVSLRTRHFELAPEQEL